MPIAHLTLLLLSAALALPALTASASEDHCSKRIAVASSPIGRGMTITARGEITGTVKSFLDTISADSGCIFEYIQVPRARAWMLLQAHSVDVLPAAVQTPERDREAHFIPTHHTTPQLLSLRKDLSDIHSISDLIQARLHVGVVRGYQFGPEYSNFVALLAQHNLLHEVPDPDTIIKLLEADRIQVTVLPLTAIADAAESKGVGERLHASTLPDFPQVRIGIYISNDTVTPKDREILERAIQRRVAQGDYERLMRLHYPAWSLKGVFKGS